jgi:uncharacterized protein YqgC (DUF456 family)
MIEGLQGFFGGLTNTLFLIAMLVGLFGMIIPIFPGGIVIWLATLLYGILFGISGWGWVFFVLITGLMLAGIFVDDVLMAGKAREQGAAWTSLLLAYVGGVVGTIMLPPFGGILVAPSVLFLIELSRKRDHRLAWQVTRGFLVGWGWSFVARFGIGLVMIALWMIWATTNAA